MCPSGATCLPAECCFSRWHYQHLTKHVGLIQGRQKVQKDKQLYTKHTHKTKDRVTRTPLKIGDELRCSGWVGSSCSTSDIRRVNLVTNPVINHERGMLKNKA
jgi:hypothetical protein